MARRMIQIAACAWASDVTKEDGGTASWLFALCDDGTLWRREAERGTPWVRITNVPVDDADEQGLAR